MRDIIKIIQQKCGKSDILVNLYMGAYNHHPAKPDAVVTVTLKYTSKLILTKK
jgi:hypothetical protein